MGRPFAVGLLVVALTVPALAQRPKAAKRPPPPPPPPPVALVREAAAFTCPTPLGVGLASHVAFCEIMTGRDPADGVIVKLPAHDGPVTLTFDLHNRHMYSEEEIQSHSAYRRYTATIGVMTMDNTLVSRAVVQSEFRSAADLIDRVGGGAGPGGVKAVAPTGTESIAVTVPEGEREVTLLGEKLTVERADDSTTYTQPGRPIADVSHLWIEYRPPSPAPPPPPAKSAKKKK